MLGVGVLVRNHLSGDFNVLGPCHMSPPGENAPSVHEGLSYLCSHCALYIDTACARHPFHVQVFSVDKFSESRIAVVRLAET